eukprot:7909782-Karenia_brevis.AAC.2
MRVQTESVNGAVLLARVHQRTDPISEARRIYCDLLCLPGGSEQVDILPALFFLFGGQHAHMIRSTDDNVNAAMIGASRRQVLHGAVHDGPSMLFVGDCDGVHDVLEMMTGKVLCG